MPSGVVFGRRRCGRGGIAWCRRGLGDQLDGSQVGQRVIEGGGPRPAFREVQGEPAGRAGQPAGHGQKAAAQGVGGDDGIALADAGGPAGHVVGQDVEAEPGRVGAEATGWQMVESDAVFQVAYGVFDFGVGSVVGFQFDGVTDAVGDERMVGVGGQQGQLREKSANQAPVRYERLRHKRNKDIGGWAVLLDRDQKTHQVDTSIKQ